HDGADDVDPEAERGPRLGDQQRDLQGGPAARRRVDLRRDRGDVLRGPARAGAEPRHVLRAGAAADPAAQPAGVLRSAERAAGREGGVDALLPRRDGAVGRAAAHRVRRELVRHPQSGRWSRRGRAGGAAAARAGIRELMHERLTLANWRRRVAELYAEVRATPDPARAWERWRAVRNDLFRDHPQSPLPEAERETFPGLPFFDYDPALRVRAEVVDREPEHYEIQTSGDTTYGFTRFAEARFEADGVSRALELYWLDGYVGGVFVPFRDATAGTETYGAGRYLL